MANETRRLFDSSKPPLKRLTAKQLQKAGHTEEHAVGAPLAKGLGEDTMVRHYQHTELDWSEFDPPDASPPEHSQAYAPRTNVSDQIAKSDDTIIRRYEHAELDWSEFDPPAPVAAPAQQARAEARARQEAALTKGQGSGSGLVDMLRRLSVPEEAPHQAAPAPLAKAQDTRSTEAYRQALVQALRDLEPAAALPAAAYRAPLQKAAPDLADTFAELTESLVEAAGMVSGLQKSMHTPPIRRPAMTASQARALGRIDASRHERIEKSGPFAEMEKAIQDAQEAFAKKGLI